MVASVDNVRRLADTQPVRPARLRLNVSDDVRQCRCLIGLLVLRWEVESFWCVSACTPRRRGVVVFLCVGAADGDGDLEARNRRNYRHRVEVSNFLSPVFVVEFVILSRSTVGGVEILNERETGWQSVSSNRGARPSGNVL